MRNPPTHAGTKRRSPLAVPRSRWTKREQRRGEVTGREARPAGGGAVGECTASDAGGPLPRDGASAPPPAASDELRLAADRWAAMIIDAYLAELRAAIEEPDEKPS